MGFDFLTNLQKLLIFMKTKNLFSAQMIFILGLPRLISNTPWEDMNWWKPAGLIECIPIFLASMFCQT